MLLSDGVRTTDAAGQDGWRRAQGADPGVQGRSGGEAPMKGQNFDFENFDTVNWRNSFP